MISARSFAVFAAQPGKAAAAASMARRVSSRVALATEATSEPSDGSATSKRAPSDAGTHSPPTNRSARRSSGSRSRSRRLAGSAVTVTPEGSQTVR